MMLQKGMKAVSYPKDNKWIDMIEQPAQETTYQVGEIVNPYGSNIKIKQPAQEPDFWMKDMVLYYYKPDDTFKYTPLYTYPAPSWQELSDVELSLLAEKYTGADGLDVVDYGRAVMKAYGEKNHG